MPFPDGPDGGADDEFAAVVFDEAFIRAAAVHEPSAEERLLAAAAARAEAEAARARVGAADEDAEEEVRYREDGEPAVRRTAGAGYAVRQPHTGLGSYGWPEYGGYRSHSRWHRTVAWVLALVMGIGVVALTFTAVYRSASSAGRRPAAPPATGRVDPPRTTAATSSAAP